MASVKPYPSKPGWWRAQVVRKGIRRTRIFPSKGAADAWARRNEEAILSGDLEPPNLKVADLLTRYAKEVSPTKKGARWEKIRLALLGRDRIAQVRLRDLGPPQVSDWQQRRLQNVSGASVRRERNLLNNAFEIARKEWGWFRANPFEGVRRPKDGRPKERVAGEGEIADVLACASSGMAAVITFALETGMRASEIASLTHADIVGRVAVLRDTKNGTRREVPLSEKAIQALRECQPKGDQRAADTALPPTIFNLSAGSISTLFKRYAVEAKIPDLTFHCLRRTAATRLAKRLNLFELCAMFGWKDPRIIQKHYYAADMDELARKLD